MSNGCRVPHSEQPNVVLCWKYMWTSMDNGNRASSLQSKWPIEYYVHIILIYNRSQLLFFYWEYALERLFVRRFSVAAGLIDRCTALLSAPRMYEWTGFRYYGLINSCSFVDTTLNGDGENYARHNSFNLFVTSSVGNVELFHISMIGSWIIICNAMPILFDLIHWNL